MNKTTLIIAFSFAGSILVSSLPGGEVRKATVRVTPLRDAIGGVTGLVGFAVPADAVSGAKRR